MARNRFVTPNTIRLDLSDGDWIEVKERLTFAEQRRLDTASFRSVRQLTDGAEGGLDFGIDMARFELLRLETWLVEWSFRDGKDKPVKLSRDAIAALDPATAVEVIAALDRHVESLTLGEVVTPTEKSASG